MPFEQIALVAIVGDPPVLAETVLHEPYGFDRNFVALFGDALATRRRLTRGFAFLLGRRALRGAREIEDVTTLLPVNRSIGGRLALRSRRTGSSAGLGVGLCPASAASALAGSLGPAVGSSVAAESVRAVRHRAEATEAAAVSRRHSTST